MAHKIRTTDDTGRVTGEIVVADDYTEVETHIFTDVNFGQYNSLTLADVDGDGDLDLLGGQWYGALKYYKNTGSATTPAFAERTGTANPFDGIDAGNTSRPALADVDGDGDLDLAVGHQDGGLKYYENTGSATTPTFAERTGTANPFDGVDVGSSSAPTFGDVNGDGVIDLVVGNAGYNGLGYGSVLAYYEYGNKGTEAEPVFGYVLRTGNDDPFDGITTAGNYNKPALGDVDNDGDLDLVVGHDYVPLEYYENTGTATMPVFAARTGNDNLFNNVDDNWGMVPALGDLDGNDVLDLVATLEFGNLQYFTRRIEKIATWIFDANGKRTGYTEDMGGDGTVDGTVTYTFDGTDRRTGHIRTVTEDRDGNGVADRTVISTYDEADRLIGRAVTENDAVGRRTLLAEDRDGDGNDDRTTTYTYDGAGRLAGSTRTDVEDRNGDGTVDRTVITTFDADGEKTGGTRTDVEDRNGDGTMDRTEIYTYDKDGRQTGYTEDADGDGTADRTEVWTFDADGRRTGHIEDADGDGTADSAETWTYDESGRRTGAIKDEDGDGTADLTVTYAYDGTGRQTGYTMIGSGHARASVNPFDGVDVGARSVPLLADVDGDGDLDLVVGEYRGVLNHYENVGTAQTPEFVARVGTANPFDGIDVGLRSVPVLADMDGDGDLDLTVGGDDGILNHYENVGTAQAPEFVARVGTANPFDGIDVGRRAAPTLADMDGDGDLDLVVGEKDGTLRHYENVGTARTPAFTLRTGTDDPFDGVVVGHRVRGNTPVPVLADTDGDGDFDLTVGERTGILHHYENVGTAAAPEFVARVAEANPFAGVDAGSHSAPALADLDGDGTLDLAVGSRDGGVEYFTASSPKTVTYAFDGEGLRTGHTVDMDGDGNPDEVMTRTFDESGRQTGYVLHGFEYDAGLAAPLRDVEAGRRSAPALADLDGDGDLDLAVGEYYGGLAWHENVGTAQTPEFAARSVGDDPLEGVDARRGSAPAFADLDDDGDLDLVLGNRDGSLSHHENVGTAQAPEFVLRDGGDDLFEGVDVGRWSSPSLGDLDGDGDFDLVVGDRTGAVNWYENAGTAQAPEFTARTGDANPFKDVDVGEWSSPVLGDADGDGDLDLAVGNHLGGLTWHENVGTVQTPEFAVRGGAADPFDGVRTARLAMPALADLNGDGSLDLLVGKPWGGLGWFTRRTVETVVFDFDSDGERSGRKMDTDDDGAMDRFEGDDRNNVLTGSAGADVLVGFRGSDSLSGGGGRDTFVFRRGDGRDTIGDFENGSDRIEFAGGVVDAFADLTVTASGNDATVGYGRGDAIVLTGVSVSDLTAQDFLFG